MNSQDLSLWIAGGAGILVSLIASYWPWFSEWYYGDVGKRWRGLVMVGAGILVAVGTWLFSCVLAWIPALLDCGNATRDLVLAFLAFIVANQTTYQVAPTSPTKERLDKLEPECD